MLAKSTIAEISSKNPVATTVLLDSTQQTPHKSTATPNKKPDDTTLLDTSPSSEAIVFTDEVRDELNNGVNNSPQSSTPLRSVTNHKQPAVSPIRPLNSSNFESYDLEKTLEAQRNEIEALQAQVKLLTEKLKTNNSPKNPRLEKQLSEQKTKIQQPTQIFAALQKCSSIDIKLKTAALHIDAEIISATLLMDSKASPYSKDFTEISTLVSKLLLDAHKSTKEKNERKSNIAKLSKLADKMPGNVSWGAAIGGAILIFIGALLAPILVGIPLINYGFFAIKPDQLSGHMHDFAAQAKIQ